MELNLKLFRLINSWAGNFEFSDSLMIFSSDQLGYAFILFLFIPLLLTLFIRNNLLSRFSRFTLLNLGYYKDMLLVALGSAFVARFVVVETIRYFYYNPRPFIVLGDIVRLVDHEAKSSMPSGHAAFYFALASAIYLYNKKLGSVYLFVAGLIGFARIYVGVHWPLDILAGAVVGILTAFALNIIYKHRLKNWFKMIV